MTVVDDFIRSMQGQNVPTNLPRPLRPPQPLGLPAGPPQPLRSPSISMPADQSLAHQLGKAAQVTGRGAVQGVVRGLNRGGITALAAGTGAEHFLGQSPISGGLLGLGYGQGAGQLGALGATAAKRGLMKSLPGLAARIPGPPAVKIGLTALGALAGLGGYFDNKPKAEPVFPRVTGVLSQYGASPEEIAEATARYQLGAELALARGQEVDEAALAEQAVAPILTRLQGTQQPGVLTQEDVLAAQMMAREFMQPSTNQALRALDATNQMFNEELGRTTHLPSGVADVYRTGNTNIDSLIRQGILASQTAAELGPQLAFQKQQQARGGQASDTLSLLDQFRPPGS